MNVRNLVLAILMGFSTLVSRSATAEIPELAGPPGMGNPYSPQMSPGYNGPMLSPAPQVGSPQPIGGMPGNPNLRSPGQVPGVRPGGMPGNPNLRPGPIPIGRPGGVRIRNAPPGPGIVGTHGQPGLVGRRTTTFYGQINGMGPRPIGPVGGRPPLGGPGVRPVGMIRGGYGRGVMVQGGYGYGAAGGYGYGGRRPCMMPCRPPLMGPCGGGRGSFVIAGGGGWGRARGYGFSAGAGINIGGFSAGAGIRIGGGFAKCFRRC